jgi:glycosyltransferase involved in cell wall biosynthesis
MGLRARVTVTLTRSLRAALVRYARMPPRRQARDDGVCILLMTAYGMGGTIRAAHVIARQLAERRPVELLSVVRRRDEPFFSPPAGVGLPALDDRRPGATPRPLRPLRRLLTRAPSVLLPPADEAAHRQGSLWTDVMLARHVRRMSGVLVATRPGLALAALQLAPPGLSVVGHEQMHLLAHPRPLRRAMARRYGELGALVVLTETDARRYAERLGPRAPRIAPIPNPASPLGGGAPDLDAPRVLAAGRLRRQKGFDLLVEAWAQVAPAHPDWTLRICGDGRNRRRLEQRVAERGVADSVTLAGACRDLGGEMSAASIFVLSSRFEGFPLVLLEAMAKGMAVVSFDCPTGPADVIDDGRNGLLVARGDVAGLASAVERLIGDRALRRRLGAAAARVADDFGVEATGRRWDALLDDLGRAPAARESPGR